MTARRGPRDEAAGTKGVENELFFACPDRADAREGSRWTCIGPRALAPGGSIPASSESTSASQLASMMFSETPMAPQVSWPSVVSSSTRVTAPVPLRSSRMRTLKFTSSMSRRCG